MFLIFTAGFQTLDSAQALCLPIGASISLLIMFFFFDSMQVVFAICTAGKIYSLFLSPNSGSFAAVDSCQVTNAYFHIYNCSCAQASY